MDATLNEDTVSLASTESSKDLNYRQRRRKLMKQKLRDIRSEKNRSTHEEQMRRHEEKKREKQRRDDEKKYMEKMLDANTQNTKTVEQLVAIAEEMWKKTKELAKTDEEFVKWEDKRKIEYFTTALGYKEFVTEFPIVTRYMVAMGQYSTRAFTRFLEKIRMTVHPPPDKREKGYMEDQWVRRQSDYVQYLWEAYQKGHYNNAEKKWIWENTYKTLKGEFDDFRDKYKSIEEKTKEDKSKHTAGLARDLLERLQSGEQSLDEQTSDALLQSLKLKLYKRRFAVVMEQLRSTREPTEATSEGRGAGPEDNDVLNKDKPKVRIIEHVDADRMHEIDKKYHLDKKTAAELPTIFETDELAD